MKNNNVQPVLRISFAYALIVSGWLFVATHLLGIFVPDPQQVTRLATYQDVLFVTVTTLLVYGLVRRELRARSVPLRRAHGEPVLVDTAATVMTMTTAIGAVDEQQDTETHQRWVESNNHISNGKRSKIL